MITEAEVFQVTLNRNVSENLLKPTMIDAAFQQWLVDYIGADFVQEILDADSYSGDTIYSGITETYLKPIIAWGVIYNNFEYISTNITDKGVIQMLIEGTANLIGRDGRLDAKFELRNTIYQLIKSFDRYCKLKEFENYKGLRLTPSFPKFYGRKRVNLHPY